MKENFKKESPLLGLEGSGGGLGFFGGAASGPTYVDDVFSTFLYDGTGDGSAQTITNGIDLSGEGGLVWSKKRDSSAFPIWTDTERGVQKYLRTDNANGEATNSGYVTQFNSDGYAIGGGGNINYDEMCSWTFRKSPGFFDVVKWDGNGSSGRTISHNLGSVPGMIVVKSYSDSGYSWTTWHRSLGTNGYLFLNSDNKEYSNSNYFPSSPNASNFTVGSAGVVNATGVSYVAYVFAHDDQSFGTDGDEAIIKCGITPSISTYSSSDIDLGFEPQFVLMKSIDVNGQWVMLDSMRGVRDSVNSPPAILYANLSSSEGTSADAGAFYNNGYGQKEFSGGNTRYIYMAIRRPHKPPTTATEVFAIDNQGTGTMPPQYHSNFVVDMALVVAFNESSTYRNRRIYTRRMWNKYLKGNLTSNKFNTNNDMFAWMDGFGNNNSSVSTTYSWMFKRAPGFFDVALYKGTGSAKSVTHNLTTTPELIIIKNRDSTDSWVVYTTVIDDSMDYMYLNSDTDKGDSSSGLPTSSVFNISGGSQVNASGDNFLALLFDSLAGISKVGTYTGTGSNVNVDCGFTGGARFIMIKRTDSAGDWYVWDSTRGIVSGNDPYFLINSNNGDVTGTDYVDPLNAGFTVTSSAPAALNADSGTYLFLAIA